MKKILLLTAIASLFAVSSAYAHCGSCAADEAHADKKECCSEGEKCCAEKKACKEECKKECEKKCSKEEAASDDTAAATKEGACCPVKNA